MPYTYEFPRPAVTVDVCLFAPAAHGLDVLLVRRGHEPHAGWLALPGGFVDIDEELDAAARRELREETGCEAGELVEVGAFGAVGRDPRGRTIGVAYAAVVAGERPAAVAGDDAAAIEWHRADDPPRLAFDHGLILGRALERVRTAPRCAAPSGGRYSASTAMQVFHDFSFEAAHFLPRVPEGHPCARMHGHSFRVRLVVDGAVDADRGWVIDFAELGAAADDVRAALDHRLLNEIDGLDNPTSERVALWIRDRVRAHLPGLTRVELNETAGFGCALDCAPPQPAE